MRPLLLWLWLVTLPWSGAAALAASPPWPCALVEVARVQAMAPQLVLPLRADAPGSLTPRDVSGLPVPLRIDQCASGAGPGLAIGFRLGLITAARELTTAEWAAVGRALDHGELMHPAPAQCAVESEPRRKGGTLHTAMCGQTRGRHRVEVSFEHLDPAHLPSPEALRSLLAAALAKL